MCWYYKKNKINNVSDLPKDIHSFIYIITNLENGMKYIGKKQLILSSRVKCTKKELIVNARKKKKIVVKESDWKNYYGSNLILKNLVKDLGISKFHREIIHICYSKKQATYYEMKYLFKYEVLENPNLYYNGNIMGKLFVKDLILY